MRVQSFPLSFIEPSNGFEEFVLYGNLQVLRLWRDLSKSIIN